MSSTQSMVRPKIEDSLCSSGKQHNHGRITRNTTELQKAARLPKTHILKEEGPLNTCVVIDILGWPKECANCHWRSKSHGSEPMVWLTDVENS